MIHSRTAIATFAFIHFSLRELSAHPTKSELDALLRFGGFPEPFLLQDEREHRVWQRDRIRRVVRDDLRDLEQVREISLVEQLVDLLPARVGSPLSIKSLREDLEVDHKTVERWLTILENLYLCFRASEEIGARADLERPAPERVAAHDEALVLSRGRPRRWRARRSSPRARRSWAPRRARASTLAAGLRPHASEQTSR